jgi:hypothetical protein
MSIPASLTAMRVGETRRKPESKPVDVAALPALLLGLNVSMPKRSSGAGTSRDPVVLSDSDSESSSSDAAEDAAGDPLPSAGDSSSDEEPAAASAASRANPSTMQSSRKRVSPDLYNTWTPNEMDISSLSIRRMAAEKRYNPNYYQKDAIEVEVPCVVFVKLSGADERWNNETGEPGDWDFEGRHKFLKDSKEPEMDQPWLKATWREGKTAWEVMMHGGRHRVAWICNHMGYKNITIVVGLNWDRSEDRIKTGAKEGHAFVKNRENGTAIRVRLVRNTRPGGPPWRMEEM